MSSSRIDIGSVEKGRRAGNRWGTVLLLPLLLTMAPFVRGASAQQTLSAAPDQGELAGPRVGVTMITGGLARDLRDELDASPVITQFGWQWERRFLASDDAGSSAITEFVLLAGGMDQGIFIPSATWLIGFRGATGTEFAVGPNLSPAGAGMAFAVGFSNRVGNLNVPVNLAVVPSPRGTRFSILTGFNMRVR